MMVLTRKDRQDRHAFEKVVSELGGVPMHFITPLLHYPQKERNDINEINQ